ncbi:Efflux RND transporter permease subunit [Sulfidibacter corallicola]|uniref:Efflux RND transporter permease subunit n=1 Tax=Sulfidibacter corallicola TaxID=2818388 RepID=A0A8A4TSW5_SULCO|nr:efflux RND transporter permease subunit [Sulfidibacter corallicola]QTD52593.1 efflux RND transporter permease subunit [Sulfidibacter corallicola]
MIRGLVEFSVERRVTIFMVALAVVAFGGVSLSRLALNLLPDISHPSFTVQTEFPNAAPGEVENLITEPVEEAVGVLKGLRQIHSVSRAGVSEVTLEFQWGADMDTLAMDIREKLDRLILPDESEKPIVLRYDPALDPIMRVSLSGSDNLTLMRYVAEKKIKDELEKLEGVASAQIKGGEEEEIHVNMMQGRVTAMGLTPGDLSQVLASSNINRPGGSLKSTESQYLVRTLNEYKDVKEIANLTITPPGSPPVKLGDVAEVSWGTKDRVEIARVNGEECVTLEIFKEGDANTVQVARAVRTTIGWLPNELPQGMKLDLLFDQSRFIQQSINEVRDALLIGGLLAICILFLFLRDPRATLIIATSIPLSVVATFMLMYKLDVSLNIMSLGGLTLGIGMLVDASIVVLEAIHRQREAGLSRARAAVEGTYEVGGAVIASVLTTIAVFFPIVFVKGIAGQLFRDQSLTVTFSLLASLIVSLSLIPMLASLGRSSGAVKAKTPANSGAGKGTLAQIEGSDESLGLFSRMYEAVLRGCLRLRWLTMAVAVIVFAASLQLYPRLTKELIPALTEGEFFYEVTMPEGTALPATDQAVLEMEAIATADDRIETIYTTVGSRGVSGGLSLKTKDENLAQVNVVLEDRGNDAVEHEVSEKLRAAYGEIPNLTVKLGRPSFFSLKTPVELLFYSEDLDLLRNYTLELKNHLLQVEGLADVRASLESGNPELTVVFDRERMARMGLNVRDVSTTLHDRVNGVVVSRFQDADRQIDIRLRNREVDRDSVTDIQNIVVGTNNGMPVTLKAVASMVPARGPAEIHRIRQARVAIISAELKGIGLNRALSRIESVIAEFPPPPGIQYERAGQSAEMSESFESLFFAILLAIFLVYLVMAATFENMVHPFIILFTIPFALTGVLLGLYLSGIAVSIIAFLGAIFLVGVVVNNAIVLVDAINRARRFGMDKLEAVVHAGKIRLRPILMTTLTTVLGLVPMAVGFGEGAELRQPLAVVVVTGLLVSTLLTLIVVPAAYMIVPSRVRTREEEEEIEAAVQEAAAIEAAEHRAAGFTPEGTR